MRTFLLVPLRTVTPLILAGWLHSASAAVGPGFFFDTCANCSDAMFAATAERAAPVPDGNYPVYVIDVMTGEVRYFTVRVWTEDPPPGADSSFGYRRSRFGKTIQPAGRHTRAMAVAGDHETITILQNGLSAAEDMILDLSLPASAEELGVVEAGIDSAIDLVGPEDSPAGRNRGVLINRFEDYVREYALNGGSLDDAARPIAQFFLSRYFQPTDTSPPVSIGSTITFPDETSIHIGINGIESDLMTGELTGVELEIITNSAKGPGLSNVPESAGQLPGFSYPDERGPKGNFTTADSLRELAQRVGKPVQNNTAGGHAGCGDINFSCSNENCALACGTE